MIHEPKVAANSFTNKRKEEKVTNTIDDVYELHDIVSSVRVKEPAKTKKTIYRIWNLIEIV